MDTLLTTAEAGRLLGLTSASVRRLERLGTLPAAARTQGGNRLFRRSEVMALARKRARVAKGGRHG